MAETIQHIVDNNRSQQHANTSTSIGVLEALKTLALENPSVAPALVSIGKDLSKMMETNLRDEKNYASQIAQLKEMLRAIEETVYTALPR
jgi:bacterioferritin (cytochrome b1)